MTMEQPDSFYDRIFSTSPAYALPPEEAPWSFLWRWCAGQIDPSDDVLELGCGPGHLASMLVCRNYLGIDFSQVAIAQAGRRCERKFVCGRLPEALSMVEPYSVVVACEFLEHVSDDLGILSTLESEVKVVATLPKKDSEGHVRWFCGVGEVVDRYRGVLEVDSAVEWTGHIGIVARRV